MLLLGYVNAIVYLKMGLLVVLLGQSENLSWFSFLSIRFILRSYNGDGANKVG